MIERGSLASWSTFLEPALKPVDSSSSISVPIPAPSNPEASFSAHFFDRSPSISTARAIYIKTVVVGISSLVLVVFAIFSIYWGSIWRTPHHTVLGWVVDFDGGFVGKAVTNSLATADPGMAGIAWKVIAASQFPNGASQLQDAVAGEKVWVAVAINAGASSNLIAAVLTANRLYKPSSAITLAGSEARNEAEYVLLPVATAQLESISQAFAVQFIQTIPNLSNVSTLILTAPHLIIRPIFYSVDNVRPFDVAVGSAVTFAGLIYLLILSFFVVLVSSAARQASGLEKRLTLTSLVIVRLCTPILAYFFITLSYTLLSCAFKLPFDRRFGNGGLVTFWMINWAGMLACGLALEALSTILTRFTPLFLIFWIISNMSMVSFPLDVLPRFYRIGYASPFYNISHAVRTVVLEPKTTVRIGMNIGILLEWAAISCVTLPLFQWMMRRKSAVAQT